MVDHTLLKPEATAADVTALIDEARNLGVLAVCVSPSMLPIRAEGLVTAAVVGFRRGSIIRWSRVLKRDWPSIKAQPRSTWSST